MSKEANKYVCVVFKKLFSLNSLYTYYFIHFIVQNASIKDN